MIELLYSMIIILGFHTLLFFILYFTVKTKKIMNKIIKSIIFLELIGFKIVIFLFALHPNYEKHLLWKKSNNNNNIFRMIPFCPIRDLYAISKDGRFLELTFELLYDQSYSLIKTTEYSIECLENYYILSSYSCPITNIIIEKKKTINHEGYKKLKINDDTYLYFTNNYKMQIAGCQAREKRTVKTPQNASSCGANSIRIN